MKNFGLKPDTVTYTSLINFFCRNGKIDEAIELLKEMKENECEADTVTFNVILGGLCREGRFDEALDMIEKLPHQVSSHRLNNRRNGLGFVRQPVMDWGVGVTIDRKKGIIPKWVVKKKKLSPKSEPNLDPKAAMAPVVSKRKAMQATTTKLIRMKQVKVCLNLHGIVTVDSATLFEGEEIEVPVAVTIPPPAPIRIIKNLRIVILLLVAEDCKTVSTINANGSCWYRTRAADHDILHEVPNAARILNQEHSEDHQIHCSREVPGSSVVGYEVKRSKCNVLIPPTIFFSDGAEQQYQCQIETPLINQLPNQGFLLSNIADVFLLELVAAVVIVSTSAKGVVGRFIEGPARIKRTVNLNKGEEATENDEPVIYEDVSMERGSFLVQQAMRAFRA
ncbi:hypothetical protein KIW84_051614 [Lathyrus oleraceus]|uniref:Pentatricopeptide repeat-containing protein n=1 Tax=Pisum sativum TaxID=3888 RepID=A0A9D4WPX3_PEA|nr:hypothetical protein KIW84_051614 [Pisum sativum]